MNDAAIYLELVQHNINLLDLITGERPNHLKKEDFSDWEVTILFYMACIYMKAACVVSGQDIQDHYTLRQVINTKKEFLSIAKSYRHIEEASRDARYEGRKFTRDYIKTRLIPKFQDVRDCAIAFLKQHKIIDVPQVDPSSLLSRRYD